MALSDRYLYTSVVEYKIVPSLLSFTYIIAWKFSKSMIIAIKNIAIQRGNAASLLGTMHSGSDLADVFYFSEPVEGFFALIIYDFDYVLLHVHTCIYYLWLLSIYELES